MPTKKTIQLKQKYLGWDFCLNWIVFGGGGAHNGSPNVTSPYHQDKTWCRLPVSLLSKFSESELGFHKLYCTSLNQALFLPVSMWNPFADAIWPLPKSLEICCWDGEAETPLIPTCSSNLTTNVLGSWSQTGQNAPLFSTLFLSNSKIAKLQHWNSWQSLVFRVVSVIATSALIP